MAVLGIAPHSTVLVDGSSGRVLVDPDADGPRRTFDPEVWMTPEGKLRWSWSDRVGGVSKTDELWMIELSEPEAENSPRSKPSRLSAGVMMCKPLVLTSGEWVMPVCTWFTEQSSKMVVSTDAGKTWDAWSEGLPSTVVYSLVEAPDGISFTVESPTKFSVQGIDKQRVGQTAANIRKLRKPEPYKGKGIRYADERVRRKAGKAGK